MRALGAIVLALIANVANAEIITGARFVDPTQHYAHGILGDSIEYSGMRVDLSDSGRFLVGFPPNTRVFEDLAPRLWDVTGDGTPEIVVIETDPPQGAQLSIYGLRDGTLSKIASTPHIGQTHRWLAPIGAGDLDGDGHIEIAYIDRPHLAKTLRIWRFENGKLTEIASQPGLTNHKIGWDHIPGGIRICGSAPEIITANADWSRIIASTFDGTSIHTRDIGAYTDPKHLNRVTQCK